VKRLLWKDEVDMAEAKAANNGNTFNVIIASDITACPYLDGVVALAETILFLLDSDGVFYLTYQHRHVSEELFFDIMRQSFHIHELPRGFIRPDFRSNPSFFIYKITKKRFSVS